MHENSMSFNWSRLDSPELSTRPLNSIYPTSDRYIRSSDEIRRAIEVFKIKNCDTKLPYSPAVAGLSLGVPVQANHSSSLSEQSQWKISTEKITSRLIVEDFYSTTLAACSSWCENYNKSSNKKKTDDVVSDDILYIDYSGVSVWSLQQGYSTPSVLVKPRVWHACVAKSSDTSLVGVGLLSGVLEFSIRSAVVLRKMINQLHWSASVVNKNPTQVFRPCVPTSILFLNGHLHGNTRGSTYSLPSEYTPITTEEELPIHVLVGDSLGRVLRLVFCSSKVVVADCYSCGSDAVLAMALSRDEKMVSISTKDEKVLVLKNWTVSSNEFAPLSLLTSYTHRSVVKGLAFSPATHKILATGGGRHDRKVRFFRQDTISLWFEIPMPGQVVGVVWLSHWEVFVAIGHSRMQKYQGLGKVINVVEKCVVENIPGDGYALSAVKTLEGVCVATSFSKLVCFTWKPSERIAEVRVEDVLENPLVLGKRMPQLR